MASLIESASGKVTTNNRDLERDDNVGIGMEEGESTTAAGVSANDQSQNQSYLSVFYRKFIAGVLICTLCILCIRFLYMHPAEWPTIVSVVMLVVSICLFCFSAYLKELEGQINAIGTKMQVDMTSLDMTTSLPLGTGSWSPQQGITPA
jgi:ATP/ADP translocase